MATPQVFLRVLYTVNSNPQYILAKSSSQVSVIRFNEATTQSAIDEPSYARAPLKACLAVICDSSPELLQDPTRDFSIYVLDPLESHPMHTGLANSSQGASSPRGVAVALGLMSWALESNDSTNILVTGTIVPNALPALEVVCALRETKRMSRPTSHSYPLLGSISQPGSSQPLHPQAQQTLTRSADFPELYIGPPRRAPGRPEGSSNLKAKSHVYASSNTDGVGSQSQPKVQMGKRPRQKPKSRYSRAPPAHSPFICAPLTRNAAVGGTSDERNAPHFSQQSHPSSQHVQLHPHTQYYIPPTNNPLLELLSAISGNSAADCTPEQKATLLLALQGLLSTNPHLLQHATTNAGSSVENREKVTKEETTHRSSTEGDEQDDGGSDIVILDSSVIDTAAFRKSSNISDRGMLPPTANRDIDSSPLPASTPPSGDDSTLPSSQTSTQASTPTLAFKARTPTSKRVVSRWIESGSLTASNIMDIPATPTPTRARKRKLDEYGQDQPHSSPPLSPPSPSPSMSRVSSCGTAFIAKQKLQSLPISRVNLASSPPARLPSMLGAMRAAASSGSCSQVGTMTAPGSFKSQEDDAPSNAIAFGTASLKRRRTLNLNEFMAEHEARKSTKARKRSSSGYNLDLDASTNGSQATPSPSNEIRSSCRHAKSSPPRPLFRSGPVVSALPHPTSTFQTSLASGNFSYNPVLSSATLPSTSQPMSTSTVTPTKNPMKNFVMPAWARTSTSMLPRLSEEALARQRAEREAKKEQVALRRREAAKAKRRRLHGDRPTKESSDEGDEPTPPINAAPRTLHPSTSGVLSTPSLPPLPTLPVFASDAVEPIPSSPPRPTRQLTAPANPTTPPPKPVASGSRLYPSPSKSGSGSLFTPSGQDASSLFTPSTPSVTRSTARAAFTPRSPTVLLQSGTHKSPRKSVSGTPWASRRPSGSHSTPKSLRLGKTPQVTPPGAVTRTPQTQTGMARRPFLLPPPSPCALRTPPIREQVRSKVSVISATQAKNKPASPPSQTQKGGKVHEEDRLSRKLEDTLPEEGASIPTERDSPAHPEQGSSGLVDSASAEDAMRVGEEYPFSPLPPSSPLPVSPLSSPAKLYASSDDAIDHIAVPDSDLLLPSASDPDPAWLSDDPDATTTAAWFTDAETTAWLTETEAWLTDTEGGPLTTDSDGAWLSDSDVAAAFGDLSALVPSSANWLSDEADVETDGEDAVALQRVFASLVERDGGAVGGQAHEGEGGSQAAAHDSGMADPGFWETMQLPVILGDGAPVLGEGATGEVSVKPEDIQALLDGLVGT